MKFIRLRKVLTKLKWLEFSVNISVAKYEGNLYLLQICVKVRQDNGM